MAMNNVMVKIKVHSIDDQVLFDLMLTSQLVDYEID
jgi:hypothetical protein